jgi:site-specific DNA-methyltransferase (adenine-specific)
MYQLFNGDCLEIMPTLPAQSVDAIITDLPYGTTACAWDSVIPFDEMWRCVKHVLKPNGAFVTTASQPFTSALVMSNPKMFKYELIWDKVSHTNPYIAKYRCLSVHENILIFSEGKTTYNPQKYYNGVTRSDKGSNGRRLGELFINKTCGYIRNMNGFANPKSIITIARESINGSNEDRGKNSLHPTQKPVALFAYFARTYTNPGDVVLDMCFGSNTTGVACIETGRNYIGIERERKYFELGERRIAHAQPPLFVETGTPANNRLHVTPKGGGQNWLFN